MTALLVALTAGAAWAANQINCDGFCIGTDGKDEMKGSANSDYMEAQRGNDVMYGRGGEDGHVDAEDGDGLDLVDCGEGQDTAFVDPGDKVASNCEEVFTD